MRTFFVYSKASTTPFNINDMPSSGGRMDLVARCINSALWLSKGLRRDTRVYVTLNGPKEPPKTLFFDGLALRRVCPDERSIGSWLNKAVEAKIDGWTKIQEGIEITNKGFAEVLQELGKNVYILTEGGKDIRDAKIEENPVFIMGDNEDIPLEIMDRIEGTKISLGPISYLASHCITLVNNELDRNEN